MTISNRVGHWRLENAASSLQSVSCQVLASFPAPPCLTWKLGQPKAWQLLPSSGHTVALHHPSVSLSVEGNLGIRRGSPPPLQVQGGR